MYVVMYNILFKIKTLFQMGNPIWVKDECGADAVIKLLNNGMDLDQRDLFLGGGTVLHFGLVHPMLIQKRSI